MKLINETIQYKSKSANHAGYFAWDHNIQGTPRPGIIIIHEWWGLNDYVRKRANMLAQEGFVALAIDMYGNGMVAENPEQASQAMNSVLENMEDGTDRLRSAYSALIAHPQVDDKSTAAIGYCFGGAMVLHMARIGMPLKAVTSFHGALGSFHIPRHGEIKADILVCHGGDDVMISMDDVTAFKQEMENANAEFEVIIHEGAQHGFTSKGADGNAVKYSLPVGYQAQADQASWSAMLAQFKRVF